VQAASHIAPRRAYASRSHFPTAVTTVNQDNTIKKRSFFLFKPVKNISMTSSSGDRLNRIEAIVESNSRAIPAMMEQRATDRLEHEERMARLEDTVIRLDDTVARLTRIEEAQNRMLASMDEDRPTVLRKLTAIENKVDTLIERNQ
jgi:hypothetical protein